MRLTTHDYRLIANIIKGEMRRKKGAIERTKTALKREQENGWDTSTSTELLGVYNSQLDTLEILFEKVECEVRK